MLCFTSKSANTPSEYLELFDKDDELLVLNLTNFI